MPHSNITTGEIYLHCSQHIEMHKQQIKVDEKILQKKRIKPSGLILAILEPISGLEPLAF